MKRSANDSEMPQHYKRKRCRKDEMPFAHRCNEPKCKWRRDATALKKKTAARTSCPSRVSLTNQSANNGTMPKHSKSPHPKANGILHTYDSQKKCKAGSEATQENKNNLYAFRRASYANRSAKNSVTLLQLKRTRQKPYTSRSL